MNIVALIPARKGSKGIKNKNIINVLNKPLIYHSIAAAKKIKEIKEIYVSTDSTKIKNISQGYGAKVPFLRPKKYSNNNSEDLVVFQHFYKWYLKNHNNKKIDLIVHLRATCPFRKTQTIKRAINIIKKDNKISCLRSFSESLFSPYKMWITKKNSATPLLKKKINGKEAHSLGRQQLPKTFNHISYIDIIRPNLTINKNTMVGKKIHLYLINLKKENFIDLDTKNDLKKLNKIIYDIKMNHLGR